MKQAQTEPSKSAAILKRPNSVVACGVGEANYVR